MSAADMTTEEATRDGGARFKGSPDRVSGEYFRTLAELLLSRRQCSSRGEVSRELRRRLSDRGLILHERTIRRHLSGEVTSIPPEVEEAMTELVVDRLGLGDEGEIREVLEEAGFDTIAAEERSPLVRSERFLPLVELWLHLNPGKSKRSLACRLQRDLRRVGLTFVVGSLESLLSGKGLVVRREVYQQQLKYLSEHGIKGEAAAHKAAQRLSDSIEHSLKGRALVDPDRFQTLCRAWQLRHREASARRLSMLLRKRLKERGIRMSINRLQKSIAGKTSRVRRVLVEVIEELLSEELVEGQAVDDLVQEVWVKREDVADLFWVEAEPIAKLAKEWLAQNPGRTTRQLAIQVSKTLEDMGYNRGHNAIQPVLGGWKKKTRGFVYRAMLQQFDGVIESRIPEEHILEPPTKLHLALTEPPEIDEDESAEEVADGRSSASEAKPTAESYLRAMREHLPGSMAPAFLDFAAFRAERLFGIPREIAKAIIRGNKPVSAVADYRKSA